MAMILALPHLRVRRLTKSKLSPRYAHYIKYKGTYSQHISDSKTLTRIKLVCYLQNGESKPVPSEKRSSIDEKPKKKVLPELDKYWKVVNDDPSDFTGWTYLLQYVDQEVRHKLWCHKCCV